MVVSCSYKGISNIPTRDKKQKLQFNNKGTFVWSLHCKSNGMSGFAEVILNMCFKKEYLLRKISYLHSVA